MTTAADRADVFEINGAKPCPRCQALAFVASHEFQHGQKRPVPLSGHESAWFCFECGHQEPSQKRV